MENVLIQTLLNTPRIGRKSARFIIDNYKGTISNLRGLYNAIIESKLKNYRIPKIELRVLEKSYSESLEVFELMKNAGIKIISESDINYPERLKRIDDKPLLLFIKGNLDALNINKSVAIIGTRKPGDFAIENGKLITKQFVENKYSIISGLALGCDTVAHTSALDNNGITVAVLPCAIDVVYPKKNSKLADNILKNGGALVSEYPIGAKMGKQNFIERDRLQSGMSDIVCILETSVNSGTTHTYNYAISQNKLVATIDNPKITSDGNAVLLTNKNVVALRNMDDTYNLINEFNKK